LRGAARAAALFLHTGPRSRVDRGESTDAVPEKENPMHIPASHESSSTRSRARRGARSRRKSLAVGAALLASLLGALVVPSTEAQSRPAAIAKGPITVDPRLVGAVAVRATQDVRVNDITEKLVPSRLLRGDREFDGNGPRITSSVTLAVSPDKRSIVAKIRFRAEETKSDWSTTEQEWERPIYTAPAGRTIASIEGAVNEDGSFEPGASSSVNFVSKKGGFQLLGPTADFKEFLNKLTEIVNKVIQAEAQLNNRTEETQEVKDYRKLIETIEQGTAFLPEEENHVHLKAPDSGPVRVFAIVGDTGGPDISNDQNPKDDTRINAITFKKLRIRFQ
jgi:hypothetical protein